MNLSSSLEDYLEAILNIRGKDGMVRVTDLSREMKVEKPSVNYAVNKLKKLKLVAHEKYKGVFLTVQGEVLANKVKKRHSIILRFLHDILGLNITDADKEACLIEHLISYNTVLRIKKFTEYIKKNSDYNEKDFKSRFDTFVETDEIFE